MNKDQAQAINRAAEFLPQQTDDQRPAIRVGGALVFGYVKVSDAGRPVLVVTVDTTDAGNSAIATDNMIAVEVNVNDSDGNVFSDLILTDN